MVNKGSALWSWVGLLAVLVGVVLYAGGFLSGERIAAGDRGSVESEPTPQRTAQAEQLTRTLHEDAVGTVRSRRTVAVAAQLPAAIVRVEVQAGSAVSAGQVLVQLDDRDLKAKVAQAKQASIGAEAGIARATQVKAQADARAAQASSARERAAKLLAEKAATIEQMEAAEAGHLAATAAVAEANAAVAGANAERERAQQAIHEAEIALGFATIHAPIDGVVAERLVEAGDLAWPGRTLLVVLDPTSLRLEARVRESLSSRLKAGDELRVTFDTLDQHVGARIAEILPSVDPRSRTFEVRAEFESLAGVRPGMFGRLAIPAGERSLVVVPQDAVRRVGQLRSVVVEHAGQWKRRLVTLGESFDDGRVEVLSGLAHGERVGLSAESQR
ncbi:MAG: efflux RND transporter periplasmic adaptor subunit [Planctomycetes bacterium]|nr:efflux RND transporter periplasmic adaptor subunit [Planctomycetota bacterium]